MGATKIKTPFMFYSLKAKNHVAKNLVQIFNIQVLLIIIVRDHFTTNKKHLNRHKFTKRILIISSST